MTEQSEKRPAWYVRAWRWLIRDNRVRYTSVDVAPDGTEYSIGGQYNPETGSLVVTHFAAVRPKSEDTILPGESDISFKSCGADPVVTIIADPNAEDAR